MIWLISALSVLLASTTPRANVGRVWLAVVASEKSPELIATKVRSLAEHFPRGLVFTAADCGGASNLFGFAADIATEPSAAEAALAKVRSTVPDAYLKRCDVKERSLLAHRVHAVDPSIANVPGDAVNWDDEDRVSTMFRLSDGRVLALIRYYEAASEDPLEGKRTRIELFTETARVLLTRNCLMPGGISVRKGLVAIQCVVGQAADNLMHDITVFASTGRELLTASHCRDPRWVDDNVIECKEESVDAAGTVILKPKRTAF